MYCISTLFPGLGPHSAELLAYFTDAARAETTYTHFLEVCCHDLIERLPFVNLE